MVVARQREQQVPRLRGWTELKNSMEPKRLHPKRVRLER